MTSRYSKVSDRTIYRILREGKMWREGVSLLHRQFPPPLWTAWAFWRISPRSWLMDPAGWVASSGALLFLIFLSSTAFLPSLPGVLLSQDLGRRWLPTWTTTNAVVSLGSARRKYNLCSSGDGRPKRMLTHWTGTGIGKTLGFSNSSRVFVGPIGVRWGW